MSKEKQIEEMAQDIWDSLPDYEHNFRDCRDAAQTLLAKGYRKQSVGEWVWFEEWSPSTTDHPRECDDCGWMCSKCETALEDMVVGYWDDAERKPTLSFCPNCGARMKGGAE